MSAHCGRAAMITVDTESRAWDGTTLGLQAGWTVIILHTLGASVLPCVAHQALWTLRVILHTIPHDQARTIVIPLTLQGFQGSQVVDPWQLTTTSSVSMDIPTRTIFMLKMNLSELCESWFEEQWHDSSLEWLGEDKNCLHGTNIVTQSATREKWEPSKVSVG